VRDLAFWSIGDGPYAAMLQTLVRSYREVGMEDDFHAFSDRDIDGAVTHRVRAFDKQHYLFKLRFLADEVARLPYRHFVFLDADNYFVRRPRPLLPLLQKAPLHAFLESDCTEPRNTRSDWWGCPLPRFIELMRSRGVTARRVYNVNAGFWIVHRDAIETVCRLMLEFWEHARAAGFFFTEEAPLAYAVHMLCADPERHLMRRHFDVWSCDWTGTFQDRVPDGRPWMFRDYFTNDEHRVDPAIVHAMRSKSALTAAGWRLAADRGLGGDRKRVGERRG